MPRPIVFIAAITVLSTMLATSCPAASGVFLSIDRDTEELLRLDADQELVTVLGVLPFDTNGAELAVLDGKLYLVNSIYPNGVTMYELDFRDASVRSSAPVTFAGVDIGHAEGLTRTGEKLLLSFSSVVNTDTHEIGLLGVDGTLTDVVDVGFGNDMDALAAGPMGKLYGFDVSGSSTDRLEEVVLSPPGLTTLIAFPGNVTHLNAMVIEGTRLHGANSQGFSLDTIDLVTEQVVDQWQHGRNLVGLTREPGYGVAAPEAGRLSVLLRPAWPNPFNPRTRLAFSLSRSGEVALDVFSIDGRRVRELHRGILSAGEHQSIWNGLDDAGRGVASGTYLVQLRAEGSSQSRKITLVR